jgi:hypothetical protein
MPIDPVDPTNSAALQRALSLTKVSDPFAASSAQLQALAQAGKLSTKTQKKTALDYLPESMPEVSVSSLAKIFDQAIAHHLSLSPSERRKNSMAAKAAVAAHNGSGALLAKNGKLLKTETGTDENDPVELPDGRGIEATGLSLAPAFQFGDFNTCPNHASCKDSCLGKTSGGNFMFGGGRDLDEMKGPRLAHLKNTLALIHDPAAFAVRLHDQITSAKKKAAKNGNKLGMRLNVLSDIHPRVYKSIIESHPDVDFYDYTKLDANPIRTHGNHHLTYSSTGTTQPAGINGNDTDVDNPHQNWRRMRRRLDTGSNVAMAFTHGSELPESVYDHETGRTYKVVNGDDHDFRPLDRQEEGSPGVIVGLKNKKNIGKEQEAHIDSSGFFTYFDPRRGKRVEIAPQPGAKQMLTNDSKPEGPPDVA